MQGRRGISFRLADLFGHRVRCIARRHGRGIGHPDPFNMRELPIWLKLMRSLVRLLGEARRQFGRNECPNWGPEFDDFLDSGWQPSHWRWSLQALYEWLRQALHSLAGSLGRWEQKVVGRHGRDVELLSRFPSFEVYREWCSPSFGFCEVIDTLLADRRSS